MNMKNLVVVESPSKTKKLAAFLGKDYTVLSSVGHIRDLPKSSLGVDLENNFEPEYVVSDAKKERIDKQYYVTTKKDEITTEIAKELLDGAEEFSLKMKLIIKKVDNDLIEKLRLRFQMI